MLPYARTVQSYSDDISPSAVRHNRQNLPKIVAKHHNQAAKGQELECWVNDSHDVLQRPVDSLKNMHVHHDSLIFGGLQRPQQIMHTPFDGNHADPLLRGMDVQARSGHLQCKVVCTNVLPEILSGKWQRLVLTRHTDEQTSEWLRCRGGENIA
jgi:hypothetical protein